MKEMRMYGESNIHSVLTCTNDPTVNPYIGRKKEITSNKLTTPNNHVCTMSICCSSIHKMYEVRVPLQEISQ